MNIRYYLIFLSVILISLQGCVAVQSFPTAARSGDTISLSVGSAEGMTKANTTITYTPNSTGTPIPIATNNIRAIIPIYPDKRTSVWNTSVANGIDFSAGHGSWLTVLVIDLPVLPTGNGTLNIQTSATYSRLASSANDVPITLEILPGTGSPSTFSYDESGTQVGDLSTAEVLPHYLFKPDLSSTIFVPEWPLYGAIEMTISGSISGTESAIDSAIRVLLEDMEQNFDSHAQMDWSRNGNDIVINIISSVGRLNYYEARTSIFFTNNSISYSSTPTVTSRYFDSNGNIVSGPEIKVTFINN